MTELGMTDSLEPRLNNESRKRLTRRTVDHDLPRVQTDDQLCLSSGKEVDSVHGRRLDLCSTVSET